MARDNFPVRFVDRFELLVRVTNKDTADGASSPLIPYLTEQGIVLNDDTTAGDNAFSAHNASKQLEKEAEELREQRDNLFNPVFKDHRDCVQFLKKLYRGNVHRLGEWGVTVDGEDRISYPVDFPERIIAIGQFIDKHNSYTPPTSPLQPFLDGNAIDLTANSADATAAVAINDAFVDISNLSEEQTELRDNLFDPVVEHLRGIGQFLFALFPDNPHHAGQWGYTVDSSPQADRVRTFTLSAGEIKAVRNVVLETKLKNIGSNPILIRKGLDGGSSPVTINPNQEFTVIRGYGQMTVENSSSTGDAEFIATLNT